MENTIPDYSTFEIALSVVGTVSIGTIIMLMLNAIKDFFPKLKGRRAIGAVYLVSAIAAALVIGFSEPDFANPFTYVAWLLITGSLTVPARGMFHVIFRSPGGVESVAGQVVEGRKIEVSEDKRY